MGNRNSKGDSDLHQFMTLVGPKLQQTSPNTRPPPLAEASLKASNDLILHVERNVKLSKNEHCFFKCFKTWLNAVENHAPAPKSLVNKSRKFLEMAFPHDISSAHGREAYRCMILAKQLTFYIISTYWCPCAESCLCVTGGNCRNSNNCTLSKFWKHYNKRGRFNCACGTQGCEFVDCARVNYSLLSASRGDVQFNDYEYLEQLDGDCRYPIHQYTKGGSNERKRYSPLKNNAHSSDSNSEPIGKPKRRRGQPLKVIQPNQSVSHTEYEPKVKKYVKDLMSSSDESDSDLPAVCWEASNCKTKTKGDTSHTNDEPSTSSTKTSTEPTFNPWSSEKRKIKPWSKGEISTKALATVKPFNYDSNGGASSRSTNNTTGGSSSRSVHGESNLRSTRRTSVVPEENVIYISSDSDSDSSSDDDETTMTTQEIERERRQVADLRRLKERVQKWTADLQTQRRRVENHNLQHLTRVGR